jgi:hypothetical protein
MLIVMTSPDAVLRNGKPDPQLAQVLINAKAAGNPVGLISNHAEPAWFKGTFGASGVQFLQSQGRQSGKIVLHNATEFALKPYDALVLAAKDEDVQMGKNGGAILVAAGWSAAQQVASLGIRVEGAAQLQEIIDLTAGWSGQWWYSGDARHYRVCALSDLSSFGKGVTQQLFAQRLTATVKGGGGRLNALLAVTSRSLLMEKVDQLDGLVWGVYPSSKSANDDDEILSDFTHCLRTTVSRVRFSKRKEPLFIRHTHSSKRSAGGGGDRTNPTDQILTIHMNPFYKQNKRLVGKHVIVVDDCTTYGVSFAVAAAFLRKSGAVSVTGVALGKFGNPLRYYEIEIGTDPYRPVGTGDFKFAAPRAFSGATSDVAQRILHALIP